MGLLDGFRRPDERTPVVRGLKPGDKVAVGAIPVHQQEQGAEYFAEFLLHIFQEVHLAYCMGPTMEKCDFVVMAVPPGAAAEIVRTVGETEEARKAGTP